MNTSVIQHHGIKGQKWGVRRFQNKDGSLTDAGKKRYEESDNKLKVSITKDPKRLAAAALMFGGAIALQANKEKLAEIGADWYTAKAKEIAMNNFGVIMYAAANGVPIDSNPKGVSLGIKQVQRGKDFIDLMFNPRVSKDKRIA